MYKHVLMIPSQNMLLNEKEDQGLTRVDRGCKRAVNKKKTLQERNTTKSLVLIRIFHKLEYFIINVKIDKIQCPVWQNINTDSLTLEFAQPPGINTPGKYLFRIICQTFAIVWNMNDFNTNL